MNVSDQLYGGAPCLSSASLSEEDAEGVWDDVEDSHHPSSSPDDSAQDDDTSGDGFAPHIVVQRLQHISQTAAFILARIAQLDLKECSGVLAYTNKVENDRRQALAHLDAVATLDTTVPDDTRWVRAALFAQCSGIHHHLMVLAVVETEPDVLAIHYSVPRVVNAETRRDGAKAAEAEDDRPLTVDVVSCGGLRWVKVRSSVPSTTDEHSASETALTEADERYLRGLRAVHSRASHCHMPFGRVPQLCVLFAHDVSPALRRSLEDGADRGGVLLRQLSDITKLGDFFHVAAEDPPRPAPFQGLRVLPPLALGVEFVCLDTTTLVALCAESCYPSSISTEERLEVLRPFKVLCEQQRREPEERAVDLHIVPAMRRYTAFAPASTHEAALRSRLGGGGAADAPVAWTPDLTWIEPLLQRPLRDKGTVSATEAEVATNALLNSMEDIRGEGECTNWIVVDVAYDEFRWMISTIAGPSEVRRARDLLKNVLVVSSHVFRFPRANGDGDRRVNTPVQRLRCSKNISLRNRIVFGAADAVHAVMLSSNRRFVNAAREANVTLFTALHPARSLTQEKLLQLPRGDGPRFPPSFDYDKRTVDE